MQIIKAKRLLALMCVNMWGKVTPNSPKSKDRQKRQLIPKHEGGWVGEEKGRKGKDKTKQNMKGQEVTGKGKGWLLITGQCLMWGKTANCFWVFKAEETNECWRRMIPLTWVKHRFWTLSELVQLIKKFYSKVLTVVGKAGSVPPGAAGHWSSKGPSSNP